MMTLCISTLISLHSVYVLATEGASVRRLKLDPGKEAGKTARYPPAAASPSKLSFSAHNKYANPSR